jgi:hypothetical protein
VTVQYAEERVERFIHDTGQTTATGDDALVAGREALDEREVRLGRAHYLAKHNLAGRLREPETTGAAAHGCQVAGARQRIDNLH